MANVLINGMGVLGRRLFRMIWDNELSKSLAADLTVTMINDMIITDLEQMAYLLQYDTVYGRWEGHDVSADVVNKALIVDNKTIEVYSEADVANLPLIANSVKISIDCTGRLPDNVLDIYKTAGSKVAIGVRNAGGAFPLVVYGINKAVNGLAYSPYGNTIAIAQILDIIEETYGINFALTNEITAYTNNNTLEDSAYLSATKKYQVGRAGAWNIIPVSNIAPKLAGLIIPTLNGKVNGSTRNVGVIAGAIMDCFVQTVNPVESEDAVKAAVKAWVYDESKKDWQMEYAEEGYISSDMIGLPYTCFDTNTCVRKMNDNFIRVSVIYDPITVAAANAALVGAYTFATQ